ncbi:MAG: hypothetical protein J1F67_05820 [Muribaculaceae bacterium]|nr:hypothetical protein [Muribaculaceae bacterium]
METDLLKRNDEVTVTIYGPDNNCLYKSTKTGYHTLDEAVRDSINNANLEVDPEDCVFEVTNDTNNISHKYRINAHGNLKLIV